MAENSIEQALSVLEAEKGNLSAEQTQRLAELASAGEGVRSGVTDTLAKAGKPADKSELVRTLELEPQYGARLKTLKAYGFLTETGEAKKGDVPPPNYERAMGTFKPEELEIASHYQKPMLLLVPETSFDAKVKALDAHKQGMQKNDTYVDEIYTDSDSGSEKITGWRAVMVDGAQKMETYEGDNLDFRFGRRVKNRKETRKAGEKGMDRHRYVLLMMEAIKNGEPIDQLNQESLTLLDDDSALDDSFVPYANFDTVSGRVFFSDNRPNSAFDGARFRSSVGGDVLLGAELLETGADVRSDVTSAFATYEKSQASKDRLR